MPSFIRQRGNGKYQFRYRGNGASISFTDAELDIVVEYRNNFLGFDPDIAPTEPRILIFDIETAPIEAYVWGLYDQNIGINQIKTDWYLLCFAYRWLGEKSNFVGLPDFDGYQCGNDGEIELVKALYNLFNEADVVVAHNAVRFDVKKLNARIVKYGLQRPSPFKVIDTLKICRSNFGFTSNKLDFVSRELGHYGKLEHDGMPLWIGCMNGDPDAWAMMKAYNIRDIETLESVYLDIRGWDKSHPNLAHYYNDGKLHCPTCGSLDIHKDEQSTYTNVQSYATWRCANCGAVKRDRKNNTVNKDLLLANT